MTARVTDWFAVVLAGTCTPLGQAADVAAVIATHLPHPSEIECWICGHAWPCRAFQDAAHEFDRRGMRVADLVPFDLHQRITGREMR